MTSPSDKETALLDRLIRATSAGTINWVPRGELNTSFRYDLPDGKFVLIDSRDDDGDAPYDLLIYGTDSKHVSGVYWNSDTASPVSAIDFQLLSLYDTARDRALGITQILDELLQEIPDPDDIPF